MPITVITRYKAACDVCSRPLDDEETGERADFPDPNSATEYAVDCCGWSVADGRLVCARQDERHAIAREG